MTIKVYQIDPNESKVYHLYSIDQDEEYTGLFVDKKTAITARAGKEDLGFELTYPADGIAGKRYFRVGDTLSLANNLELEGA